MNFEGCKYAEGLLRAVIGLSSKSNVWEYAINFFYLKNQREIKELNTQFSNIV